MLCLELLVLSYPCRLLRWGARSVAELAAADNWAHRQARTVDPAVLAVPSGEALPQDHRAAEQADNEVPAPQKARRAAAQNAGR